MKLIAAFILSLLVVSPALAQNLDFGRGEVLVKVPADYDDDSPAPLIVLLHGYTSSGAGQDTYFGVSELADDYGFLLVAPDGTEEPMGNRSRFWNASEACCNFYSSEVDDVAYIKSIIDQMKSRYSVDTNRVYLFGHSNGGFMSYRMAHEHSEEIAAIASLAGASHFGDREAPAEPVHVLQIHGTADGTIDYAGGEIQDNRYPSAMASVRQWAGYAGCEMDGKAREIRDLDASLPGHETGVMKFEVGCHPAGSAELWTISAGSHVPPLSDTYAEQVVEWLLAHPKPAAYAAD